MLSANFKPKTTAAASRGFLATSTAFLFNYSRLGLRPKVTSWELLWRNFTGRIPFLSSDQERKSAKKRCHTITDIKQDEMRSDGPQDAQISHHWLISVDLISDRDFKILVTPLLFHQWWANLKANHKLKSHLISSERIWYFKSNPKSF